MALLLMAQGLFPIAVFAQEDESLLGTCEITARSLNIRSGPGTGNSVIRSAPQGTIVIVLEVRDGWAQVRLVDGMIGWCASQYLKSLAPPKPAPTRPPEVSEPVRQTPPAAPESSGKGGSTLGAVLKWGSLVGAAVLGGLAYSEYSKGNDAYDEYETLFNDGEYETADKKFEEAEDFDSTARVYAIAGGACLGLFVLQQFVLGGSDGDASAMRRGFDPPSMAFNPAQGSVRLELIRVNLP
jgi:hypothetical protein